MSSSPKILYETESSISGKISVIQVGQERRLVVGGIIQSINANASDVEERYWGALAQVESNGLKVTSHRLTFYGLCQDCQKEKA